MQLKILDKVTQAFVNGLPPTVIDSLSDVDLIVCESVEKANEALKSLSDKEFPFDDVDRVLPADTKGAFLGEPMEVEESDQSEEEEILYVAEGFVVLCASNIADAEEAAIVLAHEIGHALGMSEAEVTALGLGTTNSTGLPVTEKENTDGPKPS